MKTFKHSGDMGDIIYSLPTIKKMGGGVLLLDTTGGENEYWCKKQCMEGKTKFNKEAFKFIQPVLSAQNYIKECREFKEGDKVDINLNNFREKFNDPNSRSKIKNLLDLHLDAFNLPEHDPNEAWITSTEKKKLDRKIVICRSPRYQSNFPWFQSNKFKFRDEAVFIGLQKEHDLFEWTFDIKIPYFKVKDGLEMCNIISGAEIFIANQTFSLALGIGLGHVKIIQEVEPHVPNVVFEGKRNMQYV